MTSPSRSTRESNSDPRLQLFAVCPRGLEAALANELVQLGAADAAADHGGAHFSGNLELAYRANLYCRIASRVLMRVARGPGAHEHALFALVYDVAWESYFTPDRLLRVDVSAIRSPLVSLDFATLRIKDAIVDRMRDRCGVRPSVDRARPDVRVFAHLTEREATLYLDLSGAPLFKRGWRADKGEAPLKENLAAGLLALSGWSPGQALLDPMCGSGTIVIEAACIATRRAPGLDRNFGFEKLEGHPRTLWRTLRDEARAAIIDRPEIPLCGRDISSTVIGLARANAALAGLQSVIDQGDVRFEVCDAREGLPHVAPPDAAGLIVCNPPYGEQSAPRSASIPKMMNDIGNRMKASFSGWETWWLTADRGLPGQMRLHETRKVVLYNGALECRFFRIPLVAGRFKPGE